MSIESDFAVLACSIEAAVRGAPWQRHETARDAACLLIKLYGHVSSAFHLARGIRPPTASEPQFDFASVFVLARATFETFLRFFHVFVHPSSQVDKDCRYYGWVLSSLRRRQRYRATLPESREILDRESQRIADCEKRLEANQCYQQLDSRKREKLKRNGQLYGWTKIAQDAGLDDWYAKHLYDFLCGHAHAGAASISQLCQAGPEKAKEMINVGLEVCLACMALAIDAFTKLYPKSRVALSCQQLRLIEYWKQFAH